ncbi:MAG: basic amino acid ABC transporter substrate-binding protein [Desulfovibrionaceae bacterium]|nr:basic amino acid ABC transporter substrate-binding protein [Desulfovibrionaceae bacterium]
MFRSLLLSIVTLGLLCGPACAADKIIVASDPTWPPMEFLDDQKNVIGYDPDMITAVAKEAGMEAEVRNIAWDGIFAGVAAGNYDVVASGVTITPEREKAFDFSKPYYEVRQIVVVRKGVACKSFDDLKGKSIGGQIGTTGIFVAQKDAASSQIKEYEDVGLAMQDLINNRIDAVICDSPVALYYANKKQGFTEKLSIAFKTEASESFAFVVKKGRKDLVEKLNRGIDAVRAKGIEAELMKKWLGE